MSFCPMCRWNTRPGARFCGRCGKVMVSAPIPVATPVEACATAPVAAKSTRRRKSKSKPKPPPQEIFETRSFFSAETSKPRKPRSKPKAPPKEIFEPKTDVSAKASKPRKQKSKSKPKPPPQEIFETRSYFSAEEANSSKARSEPKPQPRESSEPTSKEAPKVSKRRKPSFIGRMFRGTIKVAIWIVLIIGLVQLKEWGDAQRRQAFRFKPPTRQPNINRTVERRPSLAEQRHRASQRQRQRTANRTRVFEGK